MNISGSFAATPNGIGIITREPECFGPTPDTVFLSEEDCLGAIAQMPTTLPYGGFGASPVDMIGPFSNHAPTNSGFRLPRYFAYGECMIDVTWKTNGDEPVPETTSWNAIAQATRRIIEKCVNRPLMERRGGVFEAGPGGRIAIDLYRFRRHLAFLTAHNNPLGLNGARGDGLDGIRNNLQTS